MDHGQKAVAESAEAGVHIERTKPNTKMDPYKQIVDEWLEEAPYSALRILEKLREMGFDGGYSIVKAYVSSRKMDLNEKATVRFETKESKGRWTGDSSRITWCTRTESGRSCTAFSCTGVFADAVHRICHRYEHKHTDTMSSERISVLWRIPGGDSVR